MNIVIGKMGRVVAFDPARWSPVGGDAEAPPYYEALFHNNPDNTYYILGSSDWQKLHHTQRDDLNKHDNVIDMWAGWDVWRNANKSKYPKMELRIRYLEDWTKTNDDIEMDAGILFAGPNSLSNVQGHSTNVTQPDRIASVISLCANYTGPMIKYLNDHPDLRYILIVTDMKYFPPYARDWFNQPHVIMSQWSGISYCPTRDNYRSVGYTKIPTATFYSRIETSFLIDLAKEHPEPSSLDDFFGSGIDTTPIKFMIVSNEWGPSRYRLLKEAILDHIDDVSIYGKWKPETINGDPRFKGSIPYRDYLKLLQRTKYSYVATIDAGYPTPKIWEMIHYGVIPFLHTNYDKHRCIDKPEYLYVSGAKELNEKIEFLEANPGEYDKLMQQLKDMLKPGYYDGSYLNETTNKFLEMLKLPKQQIIDLYEQN